MIVSEVIPVEQPAPPTENPGKKANASFARKLVGSFGVLYLYGPHMWLIRLLGHRWGLRWARMLARIHYLSTYLGIQRHLVRQFESLQPHFDTDKSSREILRRHLEVKHLSFAEWRLSTSARGLRQIVDSRQTVKGREHLTAAHAHGKGTILVVYHHGMYKLTQRWIADLLEQEPALQDAHVYQATYVSAHYSDQALGPVARLALRDTVTTVEKAGLKRIYLQPDPKPLPIVRKLRHGHFVGLAADGVLSADFIEVPFLDGTLQLPSGWARLAALTFAPVVSIFHTSDDRDRQHLQIHEPILLSDRSEESITKAVAKCARQLEEHIRDQPWDWHIWHRIGFLNEPGQSPRLRINPSATERQIYHQET